MGGNMKSIFYFCIVKTVVRHEAAANKQRFLLPTFNVELDTERIKECGRSNTHKVIAQQYLTAPCTLLLLMS
jgi:hypothetical protein